MKIYIYHTDVENYQWFDTVRDDDIFFNREISGKVLGSKWKQIEIEPIDDDNGSKFQDNDFLTIGTGYTPIFSKNAVNKLSEDLEGVGEFLKMPFKEKEYFIFNVTHIIDVLDESKSNLVKYDNKLTRITHYHFFEEKVSRDEVIFKIPQFPWQEVYVTEIFFDLLRKYNLKGLDCKLIWNNGPLPINLMDQITII